MILRRMREAGWLTDEQLTRSLHEPIRLAKPRRVFEAPHFARSPAIQAGISGRWRAHPMLAARFAQRLSRAKPNGRALDPATLEPSESPACLHAAVVVLDNRTGDILALAGSENYFSPAAARSTRWAPRSAGSPSNPSAIGCSRTRGDPATVVADVPTEFATATGLFAPANYDRRCYGPVRYRVALANSLNISAVKVLASIGGPEVLRERLQTCGLSTLTRPASTMAWD